MTKAQSPILGGLSRTVQTAPENTDSFRAAVNNRRTIPNTWGNLASQIAQAGLVEPDIQSICSLLKITPEEFRSGKLIFQDTYGVDSFRRRLEDELLDEHQKANGIAAKKDHESLARIVSEHYAVDEDTVHLMIAQTQIEVVRLLGEANSVVENKSYANITDSEWEEHYSLKEQADLLGLKIESLRSGTCISLAQFVADILSQEVMDYFTIDNLKIALSGVIELLNDDGFGDKNPSTLYIGKKHFNVFFMSLVSQFKKVPQEEAVRRMVALAPFIYTKPIHEYPIFAGNEQ